MALSRQLQGWLHSDDDFAGVTGPKTFNGGSSGGIAGDDNGLDPPGDERCNAVSSEFSHLLCGSVAVRSVFGVSEV
jgi:hypothetical protein